MQASHELAGVCWKLVCAFAARRVRWRRIAASGLLLSALTLGPIGCSDPAEIQARIPGRYQQTQPAVEGLAQIFTLELRPDWTCAMTREYVKKGKVTQTGTWTNHGRVVVVTLQARQKRQPPEVLEFKWRGTKLVCTQWDENLYGTDGLGTFLRQESPSGQSDTLSAGGTNAEATDR